MNNRYILSAIFASIFLISIFVIFWPKTFAASTVVKSPNKTISLTDNNKKITMKVGDSFLLKLGTTYIWNLKISNQKVVRRVPNIAVVKGAQGIFKTLAPGTTTLSAVGDLPCRRSKSACVAPSRLFKITIVVKPASIPVPKKPTTTTTTTSSSGTTTNSASSNTLAGCAVFPSDNAWNQDVSKLPVRSDSATFINSIGLTKNLHPDFGSNQTYGIPFAVVESTQPKVPITFTAYGDESDPGPYPIPANAPIEGGANADGDRHVLVLQKGSCMLYELYNAHKNQTNTGWSADSGALFNLNSNKLRPAGWTSADAAGLPILPGLIRYDEIAAGVINHAIRFTAPRTQRGYILPAQHFAGSNDSTLPPMGLRVRLKANYDISKLTGSAKVIAVAMKKYGLMLADNGSSWFLQGATDPRWNDDGLNQLKSIPGSAFEAVDTGPIVH